MSERKITFAQALARIEELLKESEGYEYAETKHLLRQHADSIVQLGKVAQEMRAQLIVHHFDGDSTKPWAAPSIHGSIFKLGQAIQEFDKLVKGDT